MGVQSGTYVEVPHQVQDTTQWVVKDLEHYDSYTADQRERVCEWLRANGVDPCDVVGGAPVSVVTRCYPVSGDQSHIRFTQYVRDEKGQILANSWPFSPVTAERSVEQRVPFGDPC